jgi:hypothetical protein
VLLWVMLQHAAALHMKHSWLLLGSARDQRVLHSGTSGMGGSTLVDLICVLFACSTYMVVCACLYHHYR